ncbi:cytochrome and DOMON domain-containing protein [Aspergillus tanneri]|nr:uncharacterized protein ATNIH1004_009102 [Aspergillus tanneri]KAA8644893.1 hypothetical protein ATNIH1004_009102 [Aspergillus tanneri]
MASSNMFLLYSSSSIDVTLSPRWGEGHIEPTFNPDAQVTLLEGSGIENGIMTANVRCDNCINQENDLASSKWIWAYKEGQPLSSSNVSQKIGFHDNFGSANVDLSRSLSNSDNPFVGYDPSTSAMSSNRSGGNNKAVLVTHGFLMSFAFVLLFPSFALLVPAPLSIPVLKAHAPLQVVTLAIAIAGMGLGLRLWVGGGVPQNTDVHPILGIIVMALLILLQPLMGWFQHLQFRRNGGKSVFAHAHRWLGRTMIILGIINGGLGFRLAGIGKPGTSRGAMIAYSVIAGVMGLAYISVHLIGTMRRGAKQTSESVGETKEVNDDGEEVEK